MIKSEPSTRKQTQAARFGTGPEARLEFFRATTFLNDYTVIIQISRRFLFESILIDFKWAFLALDQFSFHQTKAA